MKLESEKSAAIMREFISRFTSWPTLVTQWGHLYFKCYLKWDCAWVSPFEQGNIIIIIIIIIMKTIKIIIIKGEAISQNPLYHFHLCHRHLDISRAVIAGSQPLHIGSSRIWTEIVWFPSASR